MSARALPVLEDIRVATPCPESWEAMRGDDRVRHCDRCDLDVFNLSGMTRDEAQALLDGRMGARTCVRLFKRHDGTVITRDCPVGLARVRRRIAAAAAFAFSLVGVGVTGALALGAWTLGRTRPAEPPEVSYVDDDVSPLDSPLLLKLGALIRGKPISTPPPHMLVGDIAWPPPTPLPPGGGGNATTSTP